MKKKAKPKRKKELVARGREALLARPVVEWLQREGWTTHEEVSVKGPVADIVATRGGVYMVVEVKAAMSFSVLEQAERWRGFAHLVFVAVPHAKDRHFQQRIAGKLGIGVISIRTPGMITAPYAKLECHGDFFRPPKPLLVTLQSALCDENLSGNGVVAGSAGSLHSTEFSRTCARLEEVVRKKPGIALRDALRELTHHYSSDRSAVAAMSRWACKGILPGVRVVDPRGRPLCLKPERKAT